jgi:hypothetical protein
MAIDSVAFHWESFVHFGAKMSDHTRTIIIFANFTNSPKRNQNFTASGSLQHRCSIFSLGGSKEEIL